jgi:hypothetical protein
MAVCLVPSLLSPLRHVTVKPPLRNEIQVLVLQARWGADVVLSKPSFYPGARIMPVIGTRDERGTAVGITCTKTQYISECRVGGWPGSFWTACGRESFAAAMGEALSRKTSRYCWPTSFKVLGVLFLREVSPAFLPSKQACWAHQFRYLGVGQQYPALL